jgi:hypothetical protein
MPGARCRTICWTPTWNKDREGVGLEQSAAAVALAIAGCGTIPQAPARLLWCSRRHCPLTLA